MSNSGRGSSPKFYDYFGWFSALLVGGILIGAGGAFILIPKLFADAIVADNPNVRVPPNLYDNVLLYGSLAIVFGLIFSIIGMYEISKSQRTVVSQPSVQSSVSVEKNYCRYCGAETKKDSKFCEKCGKQISET